jgi:hypothetical protein
MLILIGTALGAAWLGYCGYLQSDYYRARVFARFEQLQKNDSYDHMVKVMRFPPTHYCNVEVDVVDPSNGWSIATTVSKEHYTDFIYRMGEKDLIARFPHNGPDNYGALVEKRGPVPLIACAGEWSHYTQFDW